MDIGNIIIKGELTWI